MWNFTRSRQTAGNICLILFTAFLLTILVAPFSMVGSAEASITPVQQSGVGYVESDTVTVDGTDAGYNLLVKLAAENPLTAMTHSLSIKLVKDGSVISVIYGDDASYVGDSVYGAVYSMVYLAPANFTHSTTQVYGYVYWNDILLNTVILTLNPPPPDAGPVDDGSPSPSGGGSTPTETVTDTPTGIVSVEKADDGQTTATVEVDTTKVEALINSSQEVVIEAVPTGTTADTVKVELAATIMDSLAEKSKDLSIKTDEVQFVIPPAALDVAALKDLVKADPTTKITLTVTEVKQTPAVTANANLQPVGKVFNFELLAKSSSGSESKISTFAKALKVAIPYTVSDLNGVNENRLGAYRVTVNGLVFLGGEVDTAKKIVWFETGSFSEYTLMAKIAAFADIVKHWAKADIEVLVEKGIVKGVSASNFAPDSSITRAQFATLLVKALGLADVKPAKATFKDVKAGAWYYGTVEAAAAKGLVAGFNGSFNPEGKITRQEMAVMVAKALEVGGKKVSADTSLLSKFSDKGDIAVWAQSSLAVAVKEGIITGRTATTVVSKANATRAEGTVMIKKVLSSLGKL